MKPAPFFNDRRLPGRSGVASLELVMVLPLLAGCVYALFVLTKTTLNGLNTVAEARLKTFQGLRPGTVQEPLAYNANLSDGRVENLAERSIVYDGWWKAAPVVTKSGSQTMGGPWDSRSVEFATGTNDFDVHTKPLGYIAKYAESYLGGIPLDQSVDVAFQAMGFGMRLYENPIVFVPSLQSRALKYPAIAAGYVLYGNIAALEFVADTAETIADGIDAATGGFLGQLFGGDGNAGELRDAADKIRSVLNPMRQLYEASQGNEVQSF